MSGDNFGFAGMFYDAAGQEITIERYGELARDWAYKRLAYDLIGTREVSTVWLGVNMSLPGEVPLIFETMVFPECELMERYATREQALAGHAKMCRTVSAMQAEARRLRPVELPATVQALGDPRGKDDTWTLMPVDTSDGRCSQCAVQHDPGMPHDRESLAYQYSFYAEHNRWPTWADAMAHCDAATRELWRNALGARGITF